MTDPKQFNLFFPEVNNFGLNSVICQTKYILLLEYLCEREAYYTPQRAFVTFLFQVKRLTILK